jgi:hypothetical protein
MHYRVSFNTYNINAQVNNNLGHLQSKILRGGDMHWCLPLLKRGRQLVSCASRMLTPKASTWPFLLDVVDNPKTRCNALT